jgi:hypothetical protein
MARMARLKKAQEVALTYMSTDSVVKPFRVRKLRRRPPRQYTLTDSVYFEFAELNVLTVIL